jgi:hypothetical protein
MSSKIPLAYFLYACMMKAYCNEGDEEEVCLLRIVCYACYVGVSINATGVAMFTHNTNRIKRAITIAKSNSKTPLTMAVATHLGIDAKAV